MLYYSYTHTFSLSLLYFATVIVCHFLCSLMAFDCQEFTYLLAYLLTYLLTSRLLFISSRFQSEVFGQTWCI